MASDDGPEKAVLRRGAEILRLILAYEDSIQKGISRTETAHRLSILNPRFSPEFFNTLVTLNLQAEDEPFRNCRIEELAPGMIIQQDIRGVDGVLIISKGQEVTTTVISKLKNLQARHAIPGNITTSIPPMKLSSAAVASS